MHVSIQNTKNHLSIQKESNTMVFFPLHISYDFENFVSRILPDWLTVVRLISLHHAIQKTMHSHLKSIIIPF